SGIIDRIRHETNGAVAQEASLGKDLALDSLSRTELLGAIEDRYQIDLDESAISENTTVAEIEEMIQVETVQGVANIGREQNKPPPSFSRPYWALAFPMSWIRIVFYYLVLYPCTRVMCWVKSRGRENLRPLRGPVLFAANHVTLADSGLIMSVMPHRFRTRLAIAMGGERLKRYRYPAADLPLFTKFRLVFQYWASTGLMNAFPLPKRSGFRKSFDYAGEAVDSGYNILIFPEGELAEDGKLQNLRQGIGVLADGLQIPVVPVVFRDLYELKTKVKARGQGKQYFVKPGTVTVVFGEPIYYESEDTAASFTDKLEGRFRALLGGNDAAADKVGKSNHG
ncbi:MAG: hypothetical protein HKN25_07500, partial [Pyrinomonadaceae bacterium]|nr:hypothetical protein [Pyrinomonadaceae bacterium]